MIGNVHKALRTQYNSMIIEIQKNENNENQHIKLGSITMCQIYCPLQHLELIKIGAAKASVYFSLIFIY